MFKDINIPISQYPFNYIPAGAKILIGIDEGSSDGDCTVKGFYKDGEYHIQEIVNHNNEVIK